MAIKTKGRSKLTEFEKYAEMAKAGNLPANFDKWELRGGDYNVTIAHIAARNGYKFPIDFPGWEWRDDGGQTVAHNAALNSHIPHDFIGWDWKNNDGFTVKQIYDDSLAIRTNIFTPLTGSTKKGELYRSADLFCEICQNQDPYFAMAFLADSQYNYDDLIFMRDYLKKRVQKIKKD